jgi:hypothetical protein
MVEYELLTPTLKLKRKAIIPQRETEIDEIFKVHDALDAGFSPDEINRRFSCVAFSGRILACCTIPGAVRQ